MVTGRGGWGLRCLEKGSEAATEAGWGLTGADGVLQEVDEMCVVGSKGCVGAHAVAHAFEGDYVALAAGHGVEVGDEVHRRDVGVVALSGRELVESGVGGPHVGAAVLGLGVGGGRAAWCGLGVCLEGFGRVLGRGSGL